MPFPLWSYMRGKKARLMGCCGPSFAPGKFTGLHLQFFLKNYLTAGGEHDTFNLFLKLSIGLPTDATRGPEFPLAAFFVLVLKNHSFT